MLRKRLLLATNNQGKVREFQSLLATLPVQLVSLAEAGISLVVEETGRTFEENACLKACTLAAESQLLTLADDSGLEVDALHGEPGVISARYGGPGLSDTERVNFLLAKLRDVPWPKRIARFRAVIAIATPQGEIALSSGDCEGIIAFELKGEHGFGYDPVFYFPELGRTMAELTMEEKNQFSHRARAARGVPDIIRQPPFSTYLEQHS